MTASYSGTSNKDFWRGTLSGRNASADDPYTLSRTLPLPKALYERVRPQVEGLTRLIAEAKAIRLMVEAPSPSTTASSTDSLAAELERLGEPRERGLLDNDELKAAKLALIEKTRGA